MDDDRRTVQSNTDEVDLRILLRNVIGFFRKYGGVLVLFSGIGLLIGLISFMQTPREYPSKLIAHSSILTNIEQIKIIDEWRTALKKGETEVLSRIFKIDQKIVEKVTEITASDVQNAPGPPLINGFIVDVLVKDTSILDTLQKGILNGLENNEYIKPRLALRRSEVLFMIQSVNDEIQKLDSSRYFLQRGQAVKGVSANGGVIVDISELNSQMITLNEKLLLYKRELQFLNPIQVLQSFEKFKTPVKPRLMVLLFTGLLAGIFFGFVVAFILYIRKEIL